MRPMVGLPPPLPLILQCTGGFQLKTLTGFYVEGRYYGQRYSQAFARAKLLSGEYGRHIDIVYRCPRGELQRFETVITKRAA